MSSTTLCKQNYHKITIFTPHTVIASSSPTLHVSCVSARRLLRSFFGIIDTVILSNKKKSFEVNDETKQVREVISYEELTQEGSITLKWFLKMLAKLS